MAKVSTKINLDPVLKKESPQRDVPNDETIAALDEYDEMKANPENYKRYDSFSDALNEAKPPSE